MVNIKNKNYSGKTEYGRLHINRIFLHIEKVIKKIMEISSLKLLDLAKILTHFRYF